MNRSVFVVDDDAIINFLHKEILKGCNVLHEPKSFLNGQTTLQYLTENYILGDRYLIFLDINMPVMSGWDFLDAIQPLTFSNSIAVVMVTSSIDAKDREKSKSYPQVLKFLEKPLNAHTCSQIKRISNISDFFSVA